LLDFPVNTLSVGNARTLAVYRCSCRVTDAKAKRSENPVGTPRVYAVDMLFLSQ
jgi:hypothetical protein